jgi:hypothetical protein
LVIEETDAAFDPAKVRRLLQEYHVIRTEERVESAREVR